jgi:dihydroorotate dehydrogenase
MPTIAPNILSTIDDIEKYPAPQIVGMRLPMVDPTNIPMYMNGRGFMRIVYNGYWNMKSTLLYVIFMALMYKNVLKPILFLFDPEDVHDFFTATGRFLGKFWFGRFLTKSIYGYRGSDISKTVDGITYQTPFLLSAGFDYNGHLSQILPCIGMGGEEVGSVTAKPCEGNPRPRLTRLPKSQSIIVNKGLRNDGVEKIIERLKSKLLPSMNFVVSISIAKTNCNDAATVQGAIDDYVYSFKRLNEESVGDYYTINISCPNAYGGEAFITAPLLEQLLSALMKIPCNKPVYTKMPINIPWEQFDSLLKVIDQHKLQGVIIGNLNKDYNSLDFRNEAPIDYCGGLSGKPCRELSTSLIRKTREKYGRRFTIIGVGGVMSWKDAQDKFEAGADLIQLITGMIFEGPGLMRKLCKGYAEWRFSQGRPS